MQFPDFFDTDFITKPNKHQSAESIFYSVEIANTENFKNLSKFHLAIVGFPFHYAEKEDGCKDAPNIIRHDFYNLIKPFPLLKIIDFGNIKSALIDEAEKHLEELVIHLTSNHIFTIILGGSENLLLPVYKAFKQQNLLANISSVASKISLSKTGNDFLSELFYKEDNNVFNYALIGYQSYFVENSILKKLEDLNYEAIRLGEVRDNMLGIEPVLRDTNILNININSIRSSDAPANNMPSPNGFYSEEICQLANFAGFSDALNVVCISDLNPLLDNKSQSTLLTGHFLWYLLHGLNNRIPENPLNSEKKFISYHVHQDDYNLKLEFYKSNQTDRWWVKLPINSSLISTQKQFLSCSYEDYQKASANEVPDRIWKYYKKLL